MSERIEETLRQLHPRQPSENLRQRLAAALDDKTASDPYRMSWSDRCLAATAGLGALAACVIVGILLWAAVTSAPDSPRANAAANRDTPPVMMADYQRAMARGGDWMKISGL